MSQELCPDLQSPELSIPCTTPVPPGVPSPGQGVDSTLLPFTGINMLLLFLIAVAVILFAYWLIQGMKEDEDD